MRWVLLWIVLVLAAGVVLGLLGRSLWRKTKTLTAELTAASDRLAAVSATLAELAGPSPADRLDLAHDVTRDPAANEHPGTAPATRRQRTVHASPGR
ncbi:MAG: hypothetical protein QOE40_583 [Actinomycetota bacterium]|jgi:hypothetical protein|nr:hypothetical protein [Actinomycetota bacterium]